MNSVDMETWTVHADDVYVHHLQLHPSCVSVSAFIHPGDDQKHELTFT